MGRYTAARYSREDMAEGPQSAVRRKEAGDNQSVGTLSENSKPRYVEGRSRTSGNDQNVGIAALPGRNSAHRADDRTARGAFPSSVAIRAMAEQLRIAADPSEGSVDIIAWLDTADRLDAIAMTLPTTESMIPVLRGAFGIKGKACAAVLDFFLSQPGVVHSPAVLANVVGCSRGSIKVFISQLRHHLRLAGFLHIFHNMQNEGYYITNVDAERVLGFASGVRT